MNTTKSDGGRGGKSRKTVGVIKISKPDLKAMARGRIFRKIAIKQSVEELKNDEKIEQLDIPKERNQEKMMVNNESK